MLWGKKRKKKKETSLITSLFFGFWKVLVCWAFIPERKRRHSNSSQLLVPNRLPFLVLVHFQFELLGLDEAVSIPVLVVEHVLHDILHGQSGPYATFALRDLQLDELPELEAKQERGSSEGKRRSQKKNTTLSSFTNLLLRHHKIMWSPHLCSCQQTPKHLN